MMGLPFSEAPGRRFASEDEADGTRQRIQLKAFYAAVKSRVAIMPLMTIKNATGSRHV
jgi:hypothetical protein